jgi:hypothetical protein
VIDNEGSSLLVCKAVQTVEQIPPFPKFGVSCFWKAKILIKGNYIKMKEQFLNPGRWRQQRPSERRYLFTKLHGVTSQKTRNCNALLLFGH